MTLPSPVDSSNHTDMTSENSVEKSTRGEPGVQKGDASENPTEADQGLMPHATVTVTQVAGDLAKGVKTVVDEAVAWAEKKAEELSENEEEGVGPYSSPATCILSDLDPIASGVIPAMEAENVKEIQGKDVTSGEGRHQQVSGNEKG